MGHVSVVEARLTARALEACQKPRHPVHSPYDEPTGYCAIALIAITEKLPES
jgi:hypothetical protein